MSYFPGLALRSPDPCLLCILGHNSGNKYFSRAPGHKDPIEDLRKQVTAPGDVCNSLFSFVGGGGIILVG